MIDLLKILILNIELARDLYNNPLLNEYSIHQSFKNNLNKEVKEINQVTIVKEYKEILFCFYLKSRLITKLEIIIKPHYYFNNNLHNANRFTAKNCINVLTEIKNVFNLPVKELLILNIEFGVNAISPIDSKDLITYAIFHDKNEFINSSDNLRYSKISYKHNKNGNANNYKKIKFYAKGLQFPEDCDKDTFRFEPKSKRRSYIQNQLQIYSYDDLLKIETYFLFAKRIKQEFDKVLILDINNRGENLNAKEREKLKEYNNTFKWIKAIEGSKNTFNNTKKSYNNLLDKSGNNLHKKVKEIINIELQHLLKDCANLTPLKKLKDCANLNVYITENGTINNKGICPITGLELIHENSSAKYARTSTFKKLRKNNKMKYIEICSLLLGNTNGDHPKYESEIIAHLSKQVRNRFYNLSNIKQIGYNQKKYSNQMKLII